MALIDRDVPVATPAVADIARVDAPHGGLPRIVLALSAWLVVACSGSGASEDSVVRSPAPEAVGEPSSPEPAPPAVESDPIPEDEAPRPTDAPARGCELTAPRKLFDGDAWVDVEASSEGFVVAGVSRTSSGEHVIVVLLPPDGPPRPLVHLALSQGAAEGHRRAAPTLAIHGSQAGLALVDGRRQLLVARFDVRDVRTLLFQTVAAEASLRFQPAIAIHGPGFLSAWTQERSDGRRVFVRRIGTNGPAGAPRDLTPAGGGASSPTFVAGASPPRLIFLDPREATSMTYLAEASADGLGAPETARSISLITDPPVLAAAALGQADWLVYAGIGSVATTAIGLISMEGRGPPAPVVAGTGYGVLFADIAPLEEGGIIVADAPQGSSPDAPREVHVRTLDARGELDPALILRGPHETGSRARVAAAGRRLAIAFVEEDGAYIVTGACATSR